MKQPNGCSTPAPKSSAAKQWIKELAQTKEEEILATYEAHPALSRPFYLTSSHPRQGAAFHA